MDFNRIKIIGSSCVLASDSEVKEAEAKLGVTFPIEYHEYITTLGEGNLGCLVQVHPPWRIIAELDRWRDRIRQYWFWDEGAHVLTDEQAEESIVIANTLNGDELIFHPSQPERILVLPRNHDTIFEAGIGLFEAIAWVCGSGKLGEPFEPLEFEPFDSRLWEWKSWTPPPRQTTSHLPDSPTEFDLAATSSTPKECLMEFFLVLEFWEDGAYKAFGLSDCRNEEDLFENLCSLKDMLYALATPFVSENFDLGEPNSFGNPAEYGAKGPRIVDVQIFQDTAEITTIGDNKCIFDDPKRLFRLIRCGNSWQVDGLWQITKSGRRKPVKLF